MDGQQDDDIIISTGGTNPTADDYMKAYGGTESNPSSVTADDYMKAYGGASSKPVQKTKGLDVPSILDDELAKLGWSPNARVAMIANVGRENDWNPNTIFAEHIDPASNTNGRGVIRNRGIISWNNERRTAMENYVKKNGGDFTVNENNLRLQARFLDEEAKTGKWGSITDKVKNPNLAVDDYYPVFQKYILYQPRYESSNKQYEQRLRDKGFTPQQIKKITEGSSADAYMQAYGGASVPSMDSYMQEYGDIPIPSSNGSTESIIQGLEKELEVAKAAGNMQDRVMSLQNEIELYKSQAGISPVTASPTNPVNPVILPKEQTVPLSDEKFDKQGNVVKSIGGEEVRGVNVPDGAKLPDWLTDSRARTTEIPAKNQKEYDDFRSTYGLSDTEGVAEQFVLRRKAVDEGKLPDLFTQEEVDALSQLAEYNQKGEVNQIVKTERRVKAKQVEQIINQTQTTRVKSTPSFVANGKLTVPLVDENNKQVMDKVADFTYRQDNQANLAEGEYRLTDENGDTYLYRVNEDGSVGMMSEKDNDVLETISVTLPAKVNGFPAEIELAKRTRATEVADAISAKYGLDRMDVIDFFDQVGFTNIETGQALKDDEYFSSAAGKKFYQSDAINGSLPTDRTTVTVTERDLARIQQFAAQRQQSKNIYEDAKQRNLQTQDEHVAELNSRVEAGWMKREDADKEINAYNQLYKENYRFYKDSADASAVSGDYPLSNQEIATQAREETLKELGGIRKQYGSFNAKLEENKAIANLPWQQKAAETGLAFVRAIPKAIESVFKTVGALSAWTPDQLNIEGNIRSVINSFAEDDYTMYDATDSIFYKAGQGWESVGKDYLTVYPLAAKSYWATAGDSLGQVVVQASLAYLTGGLTAPTALGLSQGASAQLDDAIKSGATTGQQQIAALAGGLFAVPDVLLMRGWFKNLTKAQQVGFLNKLTARFLKDVGAKVGTETAEQATRTGVVGMLARLKKGGIDLVDSFDGIFTPKTAGGKVIGAMVKEPVQELSENKGNAVVQMFTYKPNLTVEDIFTLTEEDKHAIVGGFVGGALGGSLQAYSERSLPQSLDATNVPANLKPLTGRYNALSKSIASIAQEINNKVDTMNSLKADTTVEMIKQKTDLAVEITQLRNEAMTQIKKREELVVQLKEVIAAQSPATASSESLEQPATTPAEISPTGLPNVSGIMDTAKETGVTEPAKDKTDILLLDLERRGGGLLNELANHIEPTTEIVDGKLTYAKVYMTKQKNQLVSLGYLNNEGFLTESGRQLQTKLQTKNAPTEQVQIEAANAPTPVSEKPSKSSTQFDLPADIAQELDTYARTTIDPADVITAEMGAPTYARDGFGGEKHTTILYGIENADVSPIADLLKSDKPVEVSLGKIKVFYGKANKKPYDVIYVEVNSPQLTEMNSKIAKATGATSDFGEYKPHITLAYVKAGKGRKYANKSVFAGKTITFDNVTFSPSTGENVSIPLDQSQGLPVQQTEEQAAPIQGKGKKGKSSKKQSKSKSSPVSQEPVAELPPEVSEAEAEVVHEYNQTPDVEVWQQKADDFAKAYAEQAVSDAEIGTMKVLLASEKAAIKSAALEEAKTVHATLTQIAVMQGENVPAEVLNDYPYLKDVVKTTDEQLAPASSESLKSESIEAGDTAYTKTGVQVQVVSIKKGIAKVVVEGFFNAPTNMPVDTLTTTDPLEQVLLEARAGHYSPHLFDKFDHSFMGSGEGAQIYGWGTYFFTDEQVGSFYKRNFDRKAGAIYWRGHAVSDGIPSVFFDAVMEEFAGKEDAVSVLFSVFSSSYRYAKNQAVGFDSTTLDNLITLDFLERENKAREVERLIQRFNESGIESVFDDAGVFKSLKAVSDDKVNYIVNEGTRLNNYSKLESSGVFYAKKQMELSGFTETIGEFKTEKEAMEALLAYVVKDIPSRRILEQAQELYEKEKADLKLRGAVRYDVELLPEEHEYLLLDKTFEEQSEYVQQALLKLRDEKQNDIDTLKEGETFHQSPQSLVTNLNKFINAKENLNFRVEYDEFIAALSSLYHNYNKAFPSTIEKFPDIKEEVEGAWKRLINLHRDVRENFGDRIADQDFAAVLNDVAFIIKDAQVVLNEMLVVNTDFDKMQAVEQAYNVFSEMNEVLYDARMNLINNEKQPFFRADNMRSVLEMHYGKKTTSMFFLDAGIKGNKFLDGFSRKEGEGTYNYVIFNESDIKIDSILYSRMPETMLKMFLPEIIGAAKMQVEDFAGTKGVRLNSNALEIFNQALQTDFLGIALSPQVFAKLKAGLSRLAKQFPEQSKELNKILSDVEQLRVDSKGYAYAYAEPSISEDYGVKDVKGEEQFHRGQLAGAEGILRSVHTERFVLETYEEMKDNGARDFLVNAKGYPDMSHILVAEYVAQVANGDYEKFGLSEDDAVDLILNAAENMLEQNPDMDFNYFKQINTLTNRVFGQLEEEYEQRQQADRRKIEDAKRKDREDFQSSIGQELTGRAETGTDQGAVAVEQSVIDSAFEDLARKQRALPEDAMLRIQHAQISQLYGWAAEHIGDLTHRMAEHPTHSRDSRGSSTVSEKVAKTLRVLTQAYGFYTEVSNQVKANAQSNEEYGREESDKYRSFYFTDPIYGTKKLRELGQEYADEHKKLPVYNEMQRAARDAAVAIGEFRFNDAVKELRIIETALKDEAAYVKAASEYNPAAYSESLKSLEDWNSAAFIKQRDSIPLEQNSEGKLLAPNGEVSNLQNPELWRTVRTKEFIKWFGDWRNDPSSASKVVDTNGEPLVVYHGTESDFDTFDKNRLGSATTHPSAYWGFVTTPDSNYAGKSYASRGGGNVKQLFVNIRNPYTMPHSEYVEMMPYGRNGSAKAAFDFKRNLDEKYDGVMLSDRKGAMDEIFAFEPAQLKSVFNRGTFSANEGSMLLSKETAADTSFSTTVDTVNDTETIKRDGGLIIVKRNAKFAPVSNSIMLFQVEEDKRQQGIGNSLIAEAYKRYPVIGAQAGTVNGVRAAYKIGWRALDKPNASLDETIALWKENESLYMASPEAAAKINDVDVSEAYEDAYDMLLARTPNSNEFGVSRHVRKADSGATAHTYETGQFTLDVTTRANQFLADEDALLTLVTDFYESNATNLDVNTVQSVMYAASKIVFRLADETEQLRTANANGERWDDGTLITEEDVQLKEEELQEWQVPTEELARRYGQVGAAIGISTKDAGLEESPSSSYYKHNAAKKRTATSKELKEVGDLDKKHKEIQARLKELIEQIKATAQLIADGRKAKTDVSGLEQQLNDLKEELIKVTSSQKQLSYDVKKFLAALAEQDKTFRQRALEGTSRAFHLPTGLLFMTPRFILQNTVGNIISGALIGGARIASVLARRSGLPTQANDSDFQFFSTLEKENLRDQFAIASTALTVPYFIGSKLKQKLLKGKEFRANSIAGEMFQQMPELKDRLLGEVYASGHLENKNTDNWLTQHSIGALEKFVEWGLTPARAIEVATRNRAFVKTLEARLNSKGLDLMEIIKAGRVTDIDSRDIANALAVAKLEGFAFNPFDYNKFLNGDVPTDKWAKEVFNPAFGKLQQLTSKVPLMLGNALAFPKVISTIAYMNYRATPVPMVLDLIQGRVRPSSYASFFTSAAFLGLATLLRAVGGEDDEGKKYQDWRVFKAKGMKQPVNIGLIPVVGFHYWMTHLLSGGEFKAMDALEAFTGLGLFKTPMHELLESVGSGDLYQYISHSAAGTPIEPRTKEIVEFNLKRAGGSLVRGLFNFMQWFTPVDGAIRKLGGYNTSKEMNPYTAPFYSEINKNLRFMQDVLGNYPNKYKQNYKGEDKEARFWSEMFGFPVVDEDRALPRETPAEIALRKLSPTFESAEQTPTERSKTSISSMLKRSYSLGLYGQGEEAQKQVSQLYDKYVATGILEPKDKEEFMSSLGQSKVQVYAERLPPKDAASLKYIIDNKANSKERAQLDDVYKDKLTRSTEADSKNEKATVLQDAITAKNEGDNSKFGNLTKAEQKGIEKKEGLNQRQEAFERFPATSKVMRFNLSKDLNEKAEYIIFLEKSQKELITKKAKTPQDIAAMDKLGEAIDSYYKQKNSRPRTEVEVLNQIEQQTAKALGR